MLRKLFSEALSRSGLLRGDLNRNDRAGALHRAWGHVFTNQIAGDYLEFGVYHGDSFIESYRQYSTFRRWQQGQLTATEEWRRQVAKDYARTSVHFHGFDTFNGIPLNDEGNRTYAGGTFKADYTSVSARCAAAMPKESYTLHRGLFADVKPESVTSKIAAIVNIDGDLYSSCVDALRVARPLLQVGTVVMMDDYNAFNAAPTRGERRALAEFLESENIKFEAWYPYMFVGQSFLVTEISGGPTALQVKF